MLYGSVVFFYHIWSCICTYLYLYLMSESMVATQPENTLVPQLFGTAKVAPAAETQLYEGSDRQKVRS